MLNKKHNASILVVTIMIMGIVLVTALSISIVSIKERNASIGSSKSNQAYQYADSGIEKVMDLAVKNPNKTINELKSIGGLLSCTISGNHAVLTGIGYTVELKKPIETYATDCATIASEIASIKSVGTGGNTQRAIEAAVAAPGSWNCRTVSKASPADLAENVSVDCSSDEIVLNGGCFVSSGELIASYPNFSTATMGWRCRGNLNAKVGVSATCCK